MYGILLVNKPKGMTSHSVVGRIRRITGEKRVGHGGTLDPNGTGVLVVAVGREYTRKLDLFTKGKNKTYRAEIIFGEERDTDDVDGLITSQGKPEKKITKNEISKILEKFRGKTMQIPPDYSAIKVEGRKAYELARKNKNVALKPRDVEIFLLKIMKYKYPLLVIECEVSSGTYIRALARDIGRIVGTGAYLKNIMRTKVGEFGIEASTPLEEITEKNYQKLLIKELKE